MKLEKLSLTNFRGFESLELEFEPDINVIAGVNGVGKSSILHAIAIILANTARNIIFSKVKRIELVDSDIKIGESVTEIFGTSKFDLERVTYRYELKSQTYLGEIFSKIEGINEELQLNRAELALFMNSTSEAVNRSLQSTHYSDIDILNEYIEENEEEMVVLQKMYDEPDVEEISFSLSQDAKMFKLIHPAKENTPVLLYFSSRRQLFSERKGSAPIGASLQSLVYFRALEDRDANFNDFFSWIIYKVDSSKDTNILPQIISIIQNIMPEFNNLKIVGKEISFVKKVINLKAVQLSDGERGMIAIVFELCRRLYDANKDLSNPFDGRGIILIDEIELHLHPTWQRQILRQLKSAFKNCQFIVTSHSPQVIGQTKPESLILLARDPNTGIIYCKKRDQSFEMDSNWVLEYLTDSVDRDEQVQEKLDSARRAVEMKNLLEADQIIKELEVEIGMFPSLKAVKALLNRYKILRNNEANS